MGAGDEGPPAAPGAGAAALHAGAGPLWVCAGAFDALALLAVRVARVVALFGVQGGRWAGAREVRALVFALDAAAAGQQQWRALARQAALRGKQVAVLEPAAYGGHKDARAVWAAGVLCLAAAPAGGESPAVLEVPEHCQELWQERAAIIAYDGQLPRAEAERLAWASLQAPGSGTTGDAV